MTIRGNLWRNEFLESAAESRGKAQGAQEAAAALERRLEKLNLVSRAVWSLLQDRLGLTEQELERRVQELDLLDGKADGRVSIPASECSSCRRMMSPRHVACIYCGGKKLTRSIFETV